MNECLIIFSLFVQGAFSLESAENHGKIVLPKECETVISDKCYQAYLEVDMQFHECCRSMRKSNVFNDCASCLIKEESTINNEDPVPKSLSNKCRLKDVKGSCIRIKKKKH